MGGILNKNFKILIYFSVLLFVLIGPLNAEKIDISFQKDFINEKIEVINQGITQIEQSISEPENHPIPEPATMFLLGFGLIGIAVMGRKTTLKK